ncbi:Methyltransferase type 11 [Alkalilimnicola ehrlichii MLHE-1]|uniref:Methyltransferase type 11 n=1 Tax=Alkalilimnicola ehrlichii (strain ATCC BAA-1101 / DSM 17681 / MLHE-1) TaxID=187272 RepID=Q0A555_ALKEH|nr:Methyltransferase type 11 [Alkalilimnicola ehrlichii MLHE-1]
MGLYRDWCCPRLTALCMRNPQFLPYRRRALAEARGHVLELGAGAGANLPYYPRAVTRVTAVEPSAWLIDRARARAAELGLPLAPLQVGAEAIPLPDASVDTVVSTWTLCSVDDLARTLSEVRRVLRPGGHFLFVEHGLGPTPGLRRWQHRLNPVWRRLAGGCNLNRAVDRAVESSGLCLEGLETGFFPTGPRLLTYMYEGRARAAD